MQISEATELEDSTRQLATEFLVTLCEAREKAPGMMRKLPQHLARLFQCLVFFLLDIEVRPVLASLLASPLRFHTPSMYAALPQTCQLVVVMCIVVTARPKHFSLQRKWTSFVRREAWYADHFERVQQ